MAKTCLMVRRHGLRSSRCGPTIAVRCAGARAPSTAASACAGSACATSRARGRSPASPKRAGEHTRMMTDPIADLLTRIRNANNARKASVDVPWSRQKAEIAQVLVEEGYLEGASVVEATPRNVLRIELRYDAQRRPVITGMRRVSRPSLRGYVGAGGMPAVRRR